MGKINEGKSFSLRLTSIINRRDALIFVSRTIGLSNENCSRILPLKIPVYFVLFGFILFERRIKEGESDKGGEKHKYFEAVRTKDIAPGLN